MVRCSTFRRSRNHLRSLLRKKKTSKATGGRLSADCSWLFPPCYSFGSYGHEIEEKTIDKEENRCGKIKGRQIREDSQPPQPASCGRTQFQPRTGNPAQTVR